MQLKLIEYDASLAIWRAWNKTEDERGNVLFPWRWSSSDSETGRSKVIASRISLGDALMPFETFFKTVGKLASSCAPRAKGIDRLLSSTTGQVWERMTLVHLKQRIPPYASLFQSKQRKTSKNLGPLQIGSEFQQYETHNYVLNLGFHSYEISWVQTIRKFREIVAKSTCCGTQWGAAFHRSFSPNVVFQNGWSTSAQEASSPKGSRSPLCKAFRLK